MFVKLQMFTQVFNHPYVQNERIITQTYTLVWSGGGDISGKNPFLTFRGEVFQAHSNFDMHSDLLLRWVTNFSSQHLPEGMR